MNKKTNADIEIINYFSHAGITLKNEFELLGLIVAEMFQNGDPINKRSIISRIYKNLESESKEEIKYYYRKLLGFLL
ncbi:biofilm development regulator YmgB/AriR family protein [Serratia fonticola]|uniref:biofilm development regulator YmgB/AriR family protein n=1 Tax=Serratia fonticola TaxID=47917 RepID=UPI0021ADBC5B|nr:biofilm development regulator YmgB/AriR family protein [Serratia fonticola]